jgi:hypothetical protein
VLTVNTPTDFATALLASLGAPASPANLQAVTSWEAAEGGNWHNTARFNPLNTSLQLPGSVNYQTGKPGPGVQAYTSWAQGVQATDQTLTGSNPAYGYAPIVADLRNSAGTQALSSSVSASKWGTPAFAPGGGSTPATDLSTSLGGSTILGIPTTPPSAPSNPLDVGGDFKFAAQFFGWSIFTAMIFIIGMFFIFLGLIMLGVVLLGPVIGPAGELIPGPVGFAVGRLSKSGKGSGRGAPARTAAAMRAPSRARRSQGGNLFEQRQALNEQRHEHRMTEIEHRGSVRRSNMGRPTSATMDEPPF